MTDMTIARITASNVCFARSERARHLLAAVVLVSGFICNGVDADWELTESAASIRHYFDPVTLDKTGDFPSVLILHDFTAHSAQGELSTRYRAEFDCAARRWRLFDFATFTDHMASGAIVTYTDPGGRSSWRPLPDSPGFTRIFAFVCRE